MKKIYAVILFFFVAGCSHMGVGKSESACKEGLKELSIYNGYAPAEIAVSPLTKIDRKLDAKGQVVIRAYVSLMDGFGNQIKAPAVFRFELYEKVVHSSEPKGKRVVVWPDVDLKTPVENNRYWQDFLRAYKFDLDFQPQKGKNYVLQVTGLCPNGRRLPAQSNIAAAE
jgi:hypothetical protein